MVRRAAKGNALHLFAVREIEADCLCLQGQKKGDREYKAVITVDPLNFGLMSEAEQETILAGFRVFLHRLPAHQPIAIHVRIEPFDLEPYFAQLRNAAQHDSSLAVREMAADHEQFVRQLASQRALLQRRFYVIVGADRSSAPGKRHSRLEEFDQARSQLDLRTRDMLQDLERIGLTGHRLTTHELRLYYQSCLHTDDEFPFLTELLELGRAEVLKVMVHIATEQDGLIVHRLPDTFDAPEGLHESGHVVEECVDARVCILLIAPVPFPGIVERTEDLEETLLGDHFPGVEFRLVPDIFLQQRHFLFPGECGLGLAEVEVGCLEQADLPEILPPRFLARGPVLQVHAIARREVLRYHYHWLAFPEQFIERLLGALILANGIAHAGVVEDDDETALQERDLVDLEPGVASARLDLIETAIRLIVALEQQAHLFEGVQEEQGCTFCFGSMRAQPEQGGEKQLDAAFEVSLARLIAEVWVSRRSSDELIKLVLVVIGGDKSLDLLHLDRVCAPGRFLAVEAGDKRAVVFIRLDIRDLLAEPGQVEVVDVPRNIGGGRETEDEVVPCEAGQNAFGGQVHPVVAHLHLLLVGLLLEVVDIVQTVPALQERAEGGVLLAMFCPGKL